MQIPNCEQAFIPAAKITGYLLDEAHPVGGAKAQFFRMFGFNEDSVDSLTQGLLTLVCDNDVIEILVSDFGTKYSVDGAIETPIGRTIFIRTVWIIETAQDIPRFVTAYPQ